MRGAANWIPEYVVELAEFLVAQNRPSEAEATLRNAVNDGVTEANIALGNLLAAAGPQHEAMACYAAGYESGDSHSAFNAGLVCEEAGDPAGAHHWMRLAASGGDRWAKRWLNSASRRQKRSRKAQA